MEEKKKSKGLFAPREKKPRARNQKQVETTERDLTVAENDLAGKTVLLPSLAIEYWPYVDAIYKRGCRSIYVYSLDKEFYIDYTRKIQSTCKEMNVEYFDLEKADGTLPHFDFVLPFVDGDCVDDDVVEYIQRKKVKALKIEDMTKEVAKR